MSDAELEFWRKKLAKDEKKQELDFKKVFDAYYPVIVACRELREHYNGKNEHNVPLVMPDAAGKIMTTLRSAELQYNIVLQIEETNDGEVEIKESNQEPDQKETEQEEETV